MMEARILFVGSSIIRGQVSVVPGPDWLVQAHLLQQAAAYMDVEVDRYEGELLRRLYVRPGSKVHRWQAGILRHGEIATHVTVELHVRRWPGLNSDEEREFVRKCGEWRRALQDIYRQEVPPELDGFK